MPEIAAMTFTALLTEFLALHATREGHSYWQRQRYIAITEELDYRVNRSDAPRQVA